MAASNTGFWKKWKDIPGHFNIVNSKPFVDNENNMILVTRYSKRYEKYSGVCMYDQKEDQVKLIEKYPIDRQYTSASYCYDSNTNKLFIIPVYGEEVGIYDMKTKQWDIGKGKYNGGHASCVIMNDQIHLIGETSNHHLMYNVKKNEWVQGVDIQNELSFSVINECSKPNTLFVMGGQVISDEYGMY
eukprot:241061_1